MRLEGRDSAAKPQTAKQQSASKQHAITIQASLLKALQFIVSSSLLLSLNGAMVVIFGFVLYGSRLLPELLIAAFLVTFAVYGLNKVTDQMEDAINRPEALPKAPNYYVALSIASMTAGFLIGLFDGAFYFAVLLTPIALGVIYSVRISKSIPRLKEIVGVKSLVVALSWALTGCLLPDSIQAAKPEAASIIFAYIFIRVFVGTVLFDVLDKKGDLATGVKTIPIKLGKTRTKVLLLLLNTIGVLLVVYCLLKGLFAPFIPALLFGVVYGYFAIWFFLRANCNRFIASLMLDAEWLPMLIIISVLIQ